MGKSSGDVPISAEQNPRLLEKKLHEIYSIFDVVRQLKSSLNLEQIVNYTALTLMGHYGMASVAVFLPRDENDLELTLFHTTGLDQEHLASMAFFNVTGKFSQWLIKEDKPLVYAELQKKLKSDSDAQKLELFKCEICLPLVVNKELRGIISLGDRLFEGRFNEEDLHFLVVSSSLIAATIENARYFKMAITDGPTKLFTRRYFEIRFDEEFKRASRYKKELALLIVDVNKLKPINDTYGHQHGDVVIKKVATIIKDQIRSHDIAARYGGDEFVVILPETNHEGAVLTAERIFSTVKEAQFLMNNERVRISVSIGIAHYPSDAESPTDLFSHADKHLYRVKEIAHKKLALNGNTQY